MLYQIHFADPRRERMFLSSLSFLVAFGVIRMITYAIRAHVGPFTNMVAGGVHIHHLVFGIVLLLIVGYLWLLQVGIGASTEATWISRLTAILYGVAAALTLDEFALWLNLQDVYWEEQGRMSIDAVILFGSLLAVGVWGGRFLHALTRDVLHLVTRDALRGR